MQPKLWDIKAREHDGECYKIKGGLFGIDEEKNQVCITTQRQIALIPTKNFNIHIDLSGQICSNIDGKKKILLTVMLALGVRETGTKQKKKSYSNIFI